MAGLRLEGIRHSLLEPVDLSLAPGGLVFLSGPSGSGKSLLLRAIADLDPNQGEVWLGAETRSAMAPALWRRRVGLLPAESAWWAETVGEHLPDPETGVAPDRSDVAHYLNHLGLGTEVLDWSIARLSTGERQRLALIRLLAQRPEALLLDEVTANLDPTNRRRVEGLIDDYRRNEEAPVLWVSHDPDQRARLGGRSFVIRGGRLEPEP